jgi:hypothetical protein
VVVFNVEFGWGGLSRTGSVVRVSWFRANGLDFVTGSIDMVKCGIPAKPRLAPILVRLAGDCSGKPARIIDLPVKRKGVDATLSTHSRFLDHAECRAGEWRIFEFDAIYERDELTPAISGQQFRIDPDDMLSHYLKSQKFTLDPELAGEDRPNRVDALCRPPKRRTGQFPRTNSPQIGRQLTYFHRHACGPNWYGNP